MYACMVNSTCTYFKEEGVLVILLQNIHLVDCVGMVVAVVGIDSKLVVLMGVAGVVGVVDVVGVAGIVGVADVVGVTGLAGVVGAEREEGGRRKEEGGE